VKGGGGAELDASLGNHPLVVLALGFFFLHKNKILRLLIGDYNKKLSFEVISGTCLFFVPLRAHLRLFFLCPDSPQFP
jgi:hypothetical protein